MVDGEGEDGEAEAETAARRARLIAICRLRLRDAMSIAFRATRMLRATTRMMSTDSFRLVAKKAISWTGYA